MEHTSEPPTSRSWPELDYESSQETLETLHLWFQIVGKVRLALSPWLNHSWHATLYPTHRGFTTSPIPHGCRSFEIDFDLREHELVVGPVGEPEWRMPLAARSVADFHDELMEGLDRLGLSVRIHGYPNEVSDPIAFTEDTVHSTYDADAAERFWRAVIATHKVMTWFRAGFCGKVSPVHLFWGAPDLAVTRFSGREAPLHPGGVPNLPDRVTREAYSREVSSAGFWAGNEMVPYASFYSYAYPSPDGFGERPVEPAEASWNADLGEFLLPYEAVRTADDPDATLAAFFESTYAAAADAAGWDRDTLECSRSAPTEEEWGRS